MYGVAAHVGAPARKPRARDRGSRLRRVSTTPDGTTSPAAARRDALLRILERHVQLDPERVHQAEAVARSESCSFEEALLRAEAAAPEALLRALAEFYGVPEVDLRTTFGDPLILDLLPKEKAFALEVLPLFALERQLTVAMADPSNLAKLDEIRFITGREVLPCVALAPHLRQRLLELYGEPGSREEIVFEGGAAEGPADLELDDRDGTPVVRFVNLMLTRAIEEGASDIHLEPAPARMVVRYRVDGLLHVKPYHIPPHVAPGVVSRVKILAGMDIAEHRLPQDGRVRVRWSGRRVDVRVSSFPTIHGEKVVLRLLDTQRAAYDLESLGMSPGILRGWRELLRHRQGILLVTGPTGSGKSSTLYATLRHLQSPEINIVTLEDPVEYELEGVAQAQVNERTGLSFARGLRAILRQDPDVILVGEIRDQETAQIAVQAAMTGHLVLATLHTNDAPSAVTRLEDIGVAPYMVASALVGVLGQRLVRRLCPACTREAEPTADEREFLGRWLEAEGVPFLDGTGCERCLGKGYLGRSGVYELLRIGPELRTRIAAGATDQQLAAEARSRDYRRMWWDALEKVRQRITSLREIARAVEMDPEVGA